MSTLYKIKLQNFEGPLDLLLFFVRKDELNIYDIPLARITKSYLEYLQLMQDLNLDIASEFILMAATLMRIKVKMMLPKDPVEEEEEDMMDPREELSRRLIEYRQFKEASKSLSELDEYWRQVYRRSYFNFDLIPRNEEEVIGLKDISFFDLLAAYKKALEKKPIPVFHNVERLNVTVEEQQKYIMVFFRDRNCYLFTELCEDMAKIEIVVTFLALLDLVKRTEIAIKQASIFDDIWIYKASEFKDEGIPEAERVDTNVHELMDQIEIAQTVPETDPPLNDSEFNTDVAPVNSDMNVDEISSESSAEIKVEFIENEIKTFGVTEDYGQSEAESVSQEIIPGLSKSESGVRDAKNQVTESINEIADEQYSEPEMITSSGEKDTRVANEEDVLVTELQPETLYQPMTDELKKEEVDDEHSKPIKQPTVSADVNKEEKVEAVESLVQDTVIIGHTAGVTSEHTQTADVSSHKEDKPLNQFHAESSVSELPNQKEERSISEIKEFSSAKDELLIESARTEKKAEPAEKVPRWKSFLHKIVSIVRKMFTK